MRSHRSGAFVRAATKGWRDKYGLSLRRPGVELLEKRLMLSAMPELVANINHAPQDSSPREFEEVAGAMFFVTTTREFGREIWKTDGTEAGTVLVKDIFPGEGGSSPANLTRVGSSLYFTADDGVHGTELWKSDGTAVGTVLVKDIYAGSTGSASSSLAEMNGELFFTARDGARGLELWKSDGSAGGTVLVKNIWAPADTLYNWSQLSGLTSVDGTLFFVTSRWQYVVTSVIQYDCRLWMSDGTEAGTVVLKDINPDNSGFPPLHEDVGNFIDHAGMLYFVANDGVQELQLWRTDGTEPGTIMVAAIPGAGHLVNVSGTLFYEANDGSGHSGLWKINLTQPEVVLVRGGFQWLYGLTHVNGTLLFAAEPVNGTQGIELWKSDGTASGTVLVKDIAPNGDLLTRDGNPGGFVGVGGQVVFVADHPVYGRELWRTDGTAQGTVLVSDIVPGAEGSAAGWLTPFGGQVVFAATDPAHGQELWKTDGTAERTVLLRDMYPGDAGSNPALFTGGTSVYFAAADRSHGTELWKTDGTGEGTRLVKDIVAGDDSFAPKELIEVSGSLYFASDNSWYDATLWKSDGSSSGTVRVKSIGSGDRVGASGPDELTNLNGTLIFVANPGSASGDLARHDMLWHSDGTEVGTTAIRDFSVPNWDASPKELTEVGSSVFFSGMDTTHRRELWKTDGTATGTVLVKDIAPGTADSLPMSLTNVDGTLFFTAIGPGGRELWRSNGTESGTVLVMDIRPGTSSASPSQLTGVGGTVYFTADEGVHGTEVWKSDGTAAGTTLVADIRPGSGTSSPANLTDVNGVLYFTADDGIHGRELWKTDGTPLGTVLVSDIRAGSDGSLLGEFVNANGMLYFTADDAIHGDELWRSNGTAAGTELVLDILPGPASGSPENLAVANGAIYFSADDGFHGAEPWMLPFAPVVIDVLDVTPDPRNVAVSTVDVVFSSPIDLSMFTFEDLTLTRNGSPVQLTDAVAMDHISRTTYSMSGLEEFVSHDGTYTLTVSAAGVLDLTGNAGFGSCGDTWVIDTLLPTAAITPVAPNPRATPVPSLTIQFTEPVEGFDLGDLRLTLNGSVVPLWSATLTTSDQQTWTLNNLAAAASASGTYVFTVVAAGSGVADYAGNLLASNASTNWDMEAVAPLVTGTSPSLALGTLNAGETAVLINFSRPVVGGDLPENYELWGLGPDRLLGTDDDAILPVSTSYSQTTAILHFPGLVAGIYRLTIKDAITDLGDSRLDGDGDGAPGGDWIADFVAPDPIESPAFATTPTASSGGTIPGPVVVGDFNDDGRQDMAVINTGSDDVRVLISNGDGTFTGTTVYDSYGIDPTSVAVADFNGDGRQDLVIAFQAGLDASNKVIMLLGNGDGTFAAPTMRDCGTARPSKLVVGDFNLDGRQDLAAILGSNVGVLLGNADGTFTAASPASGSMDPKALASGDFNGDGLLDLAVANYYPYRVLILLGNGDGTLAAATAYSSGGVHPRSLAVGDFNGDGLQDVAVANSESWKVGVLLAQQDGTMAPTVSYSSGGSYAEAVTVGDFDCDGRLDLAVANQTTGNIGILMGTGSGTFSAPASFNSGGSKPQSVAVGDFNGDGFPDLAVVHRESNDVGIMLGTGGGNFVAPAMYDSGGISPQAMVVGDFNGDGHPDVATAHFSSDSVGVLLGNGDLTFPRIPSSGTGGANPYCVTAGDFNGDGWRDLAVAHYLGQVGILLGGSDGFVVAGSYSSGGSGSYSVTVGDFNEDGREDLVVANYWSDNVGVLSGNGDGTFAVVTNYASGGGGPYSAAIGDFNGDGHEDLAVATGSVEVGILVGQGDGTFVNGGTYDSGGYGTASVAVGDLNGDGRQDLVAANSIDNNIAVLLGGGNATFGAPVTYDSRGYSPRSVVVKDFDRDGRQDVVVLNGSSGNVALFRGNGNGTLGSATTYYAGGGYSYAVAVADVNDDGHQDLAVTNANSDRLAVLLGARDGTFNGPAYYSTGGSAQRGAAIGDFNGDGRQDVAVVDYDDNHVALLSGNGDGTLIATGSYPSGGSYGYSIAVGDFNGDNRQDLVVANSKSDNVGVLLGNGNGTFARTMTYRPGGLATLSPSAVTIGDFNSDGRPDIAVANSRTNEVGVLNGNGDGTFIDAVTYSTGGTYPWSIAAGDFNRDGRQDIIAGCRSNSLGLLLGSADGSFAPAVTFGCGGVDPRSVAIGDFNNDGYLDLEVACYSSRNVGVLLGNGNGTFNEPVMYDAGYETMSATIGDVNQDGCEDLIVAIFGTRMVKVLYGDGTGAFTAADMYAAGGYGPRSLAMADVDLDGRLDLVVNDSHMLYVLSNAKVPSVVTLRSPHGLLFDVQASNLMAGQLVQGTDNAFDGLNRLQVGGSDFAPTVLLNPAVDDGGLTVRTSEQTLVGLNVHREITVPAAGNADFARTVDVFHNPTSSPITTTVRIVGNLGSDASTTVFRTSDGDTIVEPSDQWIGTDDADGMGTPAIIHYIHGPSGLAPSAVSIGGDRGDNIEWTYDITVPAGGTERLAHFTILADTQAGAEAAAAALITPSGFGGEAAAFLTPEELESIANFGPDWTPSSSVAGRYIFYNNSKWDAHGTFTNGDPVANAYDDAAIALDKQALLDGQKATFANYTSYSRGINGIMIDIAGLADPAGLSVADFEFRTGNDNNPAGWPLLALDPALITVAVRLGEGVDGSDRVTILFPDGAVKKTWLQVTVKATDATGLAAPDVHYWGNAIGDSGNSPTDTAVNVVDALGVRANPHTLLKPAPIDDAYDYNRDKQVNVQDELLVRANPTTLLTDLNLIDLTGSGGAGEGEGGWSGDAWGTWDGGSLSDMRAPLDTAVSQVALVVPSTRGSDLLRAAALTSVAQRTGSAVAMGRWSPLPVEDLVSQDALADLFMLPVAPITPTVTNAVDVSHAIATLLLRGNSLLLPLTNRSPEVEHLAERLPQLSDPQRGLVKAALSESPVDDDCLVGPLREERLHGNASRTDWAPDPHGRDKQRTLDEALLELLAEWEQF